MQKMKFSIKDFFIKPDQIRGFLQIWPHLLKKSFMENFIFCAMYHQAGVFEYVCYCIQGCYNNNQIIPCKGRVESQTSCPKIANFAMKKGSPLETAFKYENLCRICYEQKSRLWYFQCNHDI